MTIAHGYACWMATGWTWRTIDSEDPACAVHGTRLSEIGAEAVCFPCMLDRWETVLAVALPGLPRSGEPCEPHGATLRLRDRSVCLRCLADDLRALAEAGPLRGAVESGRPVLRASDRLSCTRHGVPHGHDGRSFACLWCVPFLAAAADRGRRTFRPGDGTPLGRVLETTNVLAEALAGMVPAQVTVHVDPSIVPAVELPNAEATDLVHLTPAPSPEDGTRGELLVRLLAESEP